VHSNFEDVMKVEDAFLEIIAILKSHGGPTLDLPAPATEEELLSFEKAIGHTLPTALRRIYKVHNGEMRYGEPLGYDQTPLGVFYDYPFLDLTAARKQHEAWTQVRLDLREMKSSFDSEISSYPEKVVRCVYSDPGWITFAGSSPSLGLDFAPGDRGVAGQVINFSRDDLVHFQIAPDFEAFLHDVLASCRNGERNTRFGQGEKWTSLYDELVGQMRRV
jgi:internalin A